MTSAADRAELPSIDDLSLEHSLMRARNDRLEAELAEVRSTNLEMIEALRGVLRVADRQTDEFDAARDVLAKATGESA